MNQSDIYNMNHKHSHTIRVGMNKLAHEPINQLKPFYYQDGAGYYPCRNLHLTGVTASYWDWNPHKTHRIMWLETRFPVHEVQSVPHTAPYKLLVHKHVIHHNNHTGANDPWLQLVTANQESWGHKLITQGAAWLMHDASASPSVLLLSDCKIILIADHDK